MSEPVRAGRTPPRPGRIIGAFLGVFGGAVLLAIPFTPSARGQWVNLLCGLAILAAAALFERLDREPVQPRRRGP